MCIIRNRVLLWGLNFHVCPPCVSSTQWKSSKYLNTRSYDPEKFGISLQSPKHTIGNQGGELDKPGKTFLGPMNSLNMLHKKS